MPRKKKRNANGTHTIFYNENKKLWQGQICTGYAEDGHTKRKSVYGKTKKEVVDKLRQIEFDIHTGTFTDKSEITIYHLAKQMIEDAYNLNEIKENTYYRHLSTLNSLKDIYNTPLQSATSTQIKAFMLNQIEFAQSTINKQFQMLKQTFREAEKRKIIVDNPMQDMKKPNSRKKQLKVRALSIEEQQKLYYILTTEDIKYSQQMLLSMLTGLRMGEINALCIEDINLNFNTVAVNKTISRGEKGKAVLSTTTKTDAGKRIIPITNQVKLLLIDCIQDKTTGFLFTNNDKLITTNQVNSQYSRVLAKYDIIDKSIHGRIDLHSLRHTYATRCIESGIQPKVLQKLLGHTDISITLNTYCDAFEAYTNKNLELVDNYLNSILLSTTGIQEDRKTS